LDSCISEKPMCWISMSKRNSCSKSFFGVCSGHLRGRKWEACGSGPGDRAGRLGGVESQEAWASP
jgi:hypothetical protein